MPTADQLRNLYAKLPQPPALEDVDENGYYECPVCGGDGSLEGHCVVTSETVTSKEEFGCLGFQAFGIGDDVEALDKLVRLNARMAPAVIAVLEALDTVENGRPDGIIGHMLRLAEAARTLREVQ